MEVICALAKLNLVQTQDTSEYYSSLPVPQEIPIVIRPTPNDPPWSSPLAIAAWVTSVFLILLLPSLFLLPYLATLEPRIEETSALIEFAKSDKTAIFLQILSIIPAQILTLLFSWFIVTRGRRYPFREMLGWEDGGIRWWQYVVFLIGFLAIAAVVSTVAPEQDNDLIRILKSSRATLYAVAFIATFMAPLVEEVIYRGLLYSAFQRTFGVPVAFVSVTLLFALVHVPQYYPSYSTIFLLTLLSVALTALRARSRNLLPCIILHTLFNGLQSAMILAEAHYGHSLTPDPVAAILWFVK